jgi:CRP-like cAMP-binding protein
MEDLLLVSSLFEYRSFEKKQRLVDVNEHEQYFNMVCEGLVRKYIVTGKKEITLQLSTEGHFIHSEVSFFCNQPSTVIIETIEPTLLLSISKENLEKVYSLNEKMEKMGRLMATDMFIKKDHRYFSQLRHNTKDRFLRYVQNHPNMLQRVPQKYLASYLNIKPETFSRLKHLLRKRKSV